MANRYSEFRKYVKFRSDEPYFSRGVSYEEQKRITKLEYIEENEYIKAECSGSYDQIYYIEFELEDSEVVYGKCSCPIGDGGYCKHAVATLLSWGKKYLTDTTPDANLTFKNHLSLLLTTDNLVTNKQEFHIREMKAYLLKLFKEKKNTTEITQLLHFFINKTTWINSQRSPSKNTHKNLNTITEYWINLLLKMRSANKVKNQDIIDVNIIELIVQPSFILYGSKHTVIMSSFFTTLDTLAKKKLCAYLYDNFINNTKSYYDNKLITRIGQVALLLIETSHSLYQAICMKTYNTSPLVKWYFQNDQEEQAEKLLMQNEELFITDWDEKDSIAFKNYLNVITKRLYLNQSKHGLKFMIKHYKKTKQHKNVESFQILNQIFYPTGVQLASLKNDMNSSKGSKKILDNLVDNFVQNDDVNYIIDYYLASENYVDTLKTIELRPHEVFYLRDFAKVIKKLFIWDSSRTIKFIFKISNIVIQKRNTKNYYACVRSLEILFHHLENRKEKDIFFMELEKLMKKNKFKTTFINSLKLSHIQIPTGV